MPFHSKSKHNAQVRGILVFFLAGIKPLVALEIMQSMKSKLATQMGNGGFSITIQQNKHGISLMLADG